MISCSVRVYLCICMYSVPYLFRRVEQVCGCGRELYRLVISGTRRHAEGQGRNQLDSQIRDGNLDKHEILEVTHGSIQ